MNYKRIGRILVCLLLVCCLIVNISPIRAKATAVVVPAIAVAVPAPIVIGAILVGLGIMCGVGTGAFDDLVNSCSLALQNLGYVVDGMIKSWTYSGKTYASADVIEAVRSHMIQSRVAHHEFEYLSASVILSKYADASESVKAKFTEAIGYGYVIVNRQTAPWVAYSIYVCNSPIDSYVAENGQKTYVPSDGSSFLYSREGGSWTERPSASFAVTATGITLYAGSGVNKVITSADLTLGNVVLDVIEFPTAYETWGNLAIKAEVTTGDGGPDDDEPEEKILYPVTFPDSYSDVQTMDQETAQQGNLTSDPDSDSGTGSQPGNGSSSGIVSLPSWLQEGITNLSDGLSDILKTLISIPELIVQGIAKVLADVLTWAFAISDTFIATKVDALTLKYPYLDTFLALGVDLKTFLLGLGTTPPVIYINLGATNGSYNIGGQEVFMDLSWYAAYKPTMDAILGGFIWLWLAWRIYLSIPGIISGASGVWGAFSRHGESSMRAGNKGGT